MIDHQTETVFPLTEGPARLPRRRGGRRINVATLYRWSTRGLRGVVLETLQVGGTRCTSAQALQRFFDRLTTADRDAERAGDGASRPTPFHPRRRDDQATVAELERLGL
jgi:Protein of unknown function (DUF1580)